ncbi:MAG TPA: hypothetical protein VMZ28_21430 [Kofleriaceae bacterium]|nr:hypothetical protein [Kofleriaceae bacterium]
MSHRLVVALVALASACTDVSTPPASPAAGAAARPDPATDVAVEALRGGRFDEAGRAAGDVLARDRKNSRAAAIRALARYQRAMEALWQDAERAIGERIDDVRLRAALVTAERELAQVDGDLAIAAADPAFSLELCLACWRHDWNHSGDIDDRDVLLFQIEVDQRGEELPERDPRRMPTFRFDAGDILWARAMVSFQRAALDLGAAYRWGALADLGIFDAPVLVRIPLEDRERVHRARDLVLAGLDHADACRAAYLAETDDDREWVPSPRQRSYAAPLPVDAALYDTWSGVVGDLRRLVRGEEGIDVAEAVRLANPEWARVPGGYIDIGRMFAEPRDIVIDLPALIALDGDKADVLAGGLESFFGVYYRDRMKPSPLVGRLARMRAELDRGDDALERKLRYLFWLN